MPPFEGTDVVSLREPQRPSSMEQEPNTSDNTDQAGRGRESDRKRACALVGSALSQLPIWGILPRLASLEFFSQPQASQ